MQISSPVFSNDQQVPARYTCKGQNISPPLQFHEVPPEAKSLVLIVTDLDSPDRWIHWLVYNIPPALKGMEEGQIPGGAINGVCSGGTHGYEGPCPKYFSGIHRYRFKLHALNVNLSVPYSADTEVILNEMEGHVLGTAELIGVARGELEKVTAAGR